MENRYEKPLVTVDTEDPKLGTVQIDLQNFSIEVLFKNDSAEEFKNSNKMLCEISFKFFDESKNKAEFLGLTTLIIRGEGKKLSVSDTCAILGETYLPDGVDL
jgi:hypothetical protein